MKNYIGFVNDHSGSMTTLRSAAMKDYNTTIEAIKNAASREMLDTVVSVVAVGVGKGMPGSSYSGNGYGCTRQVQISNPHVLKPVTTWSTEGGTPLFDGIGNIIDLLESLPDAKNENVSVLVSITTDGDEAHSQYETRASLASKIQRLQNTGRWTFVFRVPKNGKQKLGGLGVPDGNIQEWDTTTAGYEAATVATTAAIDSYFTARSAGSTSTNVFYANAQAVDTSKLKDITKDVSLYVVPADKMGIEIKEFILTKRMQYLNGSAFYQLTKTEAKVAPTKLIAIRDRKTGAIYSGSDARNMLGITTTNNARLHPGDHGNYDIFIQSNSVNRKLVAGTGVLYWEAIGKPFTESDLAYLKPKAAPAVVQLPAVAPAYKPTPSPIPVAAKVPAGPMVDNKPVLFFNTRSEARSFAQASGKTVQDSNKLGMYFLGKRWFVFI